MHGPLTPWIRYCAQYALLYYDRQHAQVWYSNHCKEQIEEEPVQNKCSISPFILIIVITVFSLQSFDVPYHFFSIFSNSRRFIPWYQFTSCRNWIFSCFAFFNRGLAHQYGHYDNDSAQWGWHWVVPCSMVNIHNEDGNKETGHCHTLRCKQIVSWKDIFTIPFSEGLE